MISFIVNGEKLEVPSKWSDVPFWKYEKYVNTTDRKEATKINLFTGLDPKAKVAGTHFIHLLKALDFADKDIDTNYVPPQTIEFKGKEIEIPTDIGNNMLAQYTDLKELLNAKNVFDNIGLACAIYFQPLVDGDYSITKAKAMVKDVKELPADFVFCMGGFFLMNALGLQNGFLKSYLRAGTRMKKLRQGMNSLMKHLGFSLRLTT